MTDFLLVFVRSKIANSSNLRYSLVRIVWSGSRNIKLLRKVFDENCPPFIGWHCKLYGKENAIFGVNSFEIPQIIYMQKRCHKRHTRPLYRVRWTFKLHATKIIHTGGKGVCRTNTQTRIMRGILMVYWTEIVMSYAWYHAGWYVEVSRYPMCSN